MAEEWRLDQGKLAGLAVGPVVTFVPFGDELRVCDTRGGVLVRLHAAQLAQALADGGLTMRLQSADAATDATLARVVTRPGEAASISLRNDPEFQATTTQYEVERRLYQATNHWTLPVFPTSYTGNDEGHLRFRAEAAVLGVHGDAPVAQSEDGGHIHAGRLLMNRWPECLRGQGGHPERRQHSSVTYQKRPSRLHRRRVHRPQPGWTVMALLEKLGQLHDSGVLSDDEFTTKKAELLARL